MSKYKELKKRMGVWSRERIVTLVLEARLPLERLSFQRAGFKNGRVDVPSKPPSAAPT